MKLLLVEDDATVARMIADSLQREQHTIEIAPDGTTGFRKAREGDYALVLLDVMLPGMDGWQICRALRQHRIVVPILMLTVRDTISDRVTGLEAGADDYLPKPFAFPELRARVRALLHRDTVHKARLFQIADMEIDTIRRRVTRAGHAVDLTSREYAILEALAVREGQTLSREQLQHLAWHEDELYSNVIDVRISALRRKIDPIDTTVKLIHTVHGAGYVLRQTPKTDAPPE